MPLRNQNEDLFKDSRMSFGEHLEELRHVLIRSMFGIAVGCVLGFLVGEPVVKFLQTPLENALTKFYVKEGKQRLRDENGHLAPKFAKLLDEQQMVPETFLVEPEQLAAGLRSLAPGFLDGVTFGTNRFSINDFSDNDVLALCNDWAKLNSDDEVKLAQWKLLWGLTSESDKQRLLKLGEKNSEQLADNSAEAELNQSEKQSFVKILNKLLLNLEISDSPEFDVMIRPMDDSLADLAADKSENELHDMKQQLTQQFDPDLAEELNRQLISESFGLAVANVERNFFPLTVWKSARFKSQSLGATEPFMIWVKASIVTGLVLSSPWVFFQLWSFVAAGLYPAEQKYVYYFLPISLGLFLVGALLAFFFVFEPVLDFLFSFNARMGISPQPRINDWLSFVMFLPLGFGIAFQLPLVMLFANRIELISVEAYTSNWRIAVVAIFGLSMILTPADPISMIMLAIPLTGLYFLGILLCKRFNQPSNPYAAATS